MSTDSASRAQQFSRRAERDADIEGQRERARERAREREENARERAREREPDRYRQSKRERLLSNCHSRYAFFYERFEHFQGGRARCLSGDWMDKTAVKQQAATSQ